MRVIRIIKGFTLLELIIVIIITGVLATLAIPRFTKMIQYSKGMEAIRAISVVRNSIERCVLYPGMQEKFDECDEFDELDIEDPGNAAGSIFDYEIFTIQAGNPNLKYRIRATRNDLGGGGGGCIPPPPEGHWIEFAYNDNGPAVRSGEGFYASMK